MNWPLVTRRRMNLALLGAAKRAEKQVARAQKEKDDLYRMLSGEVNRYRALAMALVRRAGERVTVDVPRIQDTVDRFRLSLREFPETRTEPRRVRMDLLFGRGADEVVTPDANAQEAVGEAALGRE